MISVSLEPPPLVPLKPDQETEPASNLLTRAIEACGGRDNLPRLNQYMSETKAKR
jgi:hypothetical protein